ncbi:hypothetical protein GALL_489940 [mine drainage metagenome]|uniref:Uncharacterized protein n=1 Tax=mine drainage metagenome TaxID=410659 RepID=A0A1J5Q0M1_9ZZZZ
MKALVPVRKVLELVVTVINGLEVSCSTVPRISVKAWVSAAASLAGMSLPRPLMAPCQSSTGRVDSSVVLV